MAGQPKAPFYFAVFVVVAALVGFAAYRAMRPAGQGGEANPHGPDIAIPGAGGGGGGGGRRRKAEAHDTASITTVKEYKYKPSERLPAVKGTAAYKPMQNNTVRFALNVWAGWAPIIHANNGFKAAKAWKGADGSAPESKSRNRRGSWDATRRTRCNPEWSTATPRWSTGLVQKIKAEVDFECAVIGTGKLSELIAKHSTSLGSIDPDLTLHGLRILYERNADGATARPQKRR